MKDNDEIYREVAEELRDTLRELRLVIVDLRVLLDAEIKGRIPERDRR
jgi:hypothetical protein